MNAPGLDRDDLERADMLVLKAEITPGRGRIASRLVGGPDLLEDARALADVIDQAYDALPRRLTVMVGYRGYFTPTNWPEGLKAMLEHLGAE